MALHTDAMLPLLYVPSHCNMFSLFAIVHSFMLKHRMSPHIRETNHVAKITYAGDVTALYVKLKVTCSGGHGFLHLLIVDISDTVKTHGILNLLMEVAIRCAVLEVSREIHHASIYGGVLSTWCPYITLITGHTGHHFNRVI